MKTCGACGTAKETTEFNRNKVKPDGLQTNCRVCDNIRSRTYYAANKERMVGQITERNRKNRAVVLQWVCEYLHQHPCVDCGEADIVVLEFDHLGDKEADVSKLYLNNYSIKKIEQEIAKCEVVCANCHNRRTARRGNHYRHVWQQSRGSSAGTRVGL